MCKKIVLFLAVFAFSDNWAADGYTKLKSFYETAKELSVQNVSQFSGDLSANNDFEGVCCFKFESLCRSDMLSIYKNTYGDFFGPLLQPEKANKLIITVSNTSKELSFQEARIFEVDGVDFIFAKVMSSHMKENPVGYCYYWK